MFEKDDLKRERFLALVARGVTKCRSAQLVPVLEVEEVLHVDNADNYLRYAAKQLGFERWNNAGRSCVCCVHLRVLTWCLKTCSSYVSSLIVESGAALLSLVMTCHDYLFNLILYITDYCWPLDMYKVLGKTRYEQEQLKLITAQYNLFCVPRRQKIRKDLENKGLSGTAS